MEVVVAPRLQLLIGVPSILEYPHHEQRDGIGDMPLMLKFRVASAPRKEGDYLITLLLKATVPTGSNATSSHAAVRQSGARRRQGVETARRPVDAWAESPAGDTALLGRQLLCGTLAFQYHARIGSRPELEVNSVHYLTGKYDSQTQAFDPRPGIRQGALLRAFQHFRRHRLSNRCHTVPHLQPPAHRSLRFPF